MQVITNAIAAYVATVSPIESYDSNRSDARVLIITDRTELDEQIEKVFGGVNQQIYRTKSGADLIDTLNATTPWLIGSLVHKFSGRGDESDESAAAGVKGFVDALKQLPPGFKAKGDVYVFVDECHRTQSGELNKAMRAILPDALFIGFTGTPLLHADKQRSKDVFGEFIHTYKFDQAVREGVVLDLRYEAREVDQGITSQDKIDEWFDAKTKGLNDIAKRALKDRWGTMQQVLSSQSRLEKIVADILLDMATRPRLMDGHGNAMLVAQNIFDACRFYELFSKGELKGKCAIVTSYAPSLADIRGETTGAGETDNQIKYAIYRQMLGDWFNEAPQTAINKVELFEKQVKKKFIDEPGQMKLLKVGRFDVDVVRKDIKNLHLGVYPPDGRIRIAVPLVIQDDAVRLAVIDKIGWIKRQQAKFRAQPRQSAREMVSGETHFYLGQRYRLRVHESDGRAHVALRGKATMDLFAERDASVERRALLLQEWYRAQLKNMLLPLLEKWEPLAGVKASHFGVKRMKTKWGSCNPESRRVWFNLELAKHPVQCLEYIVVHELVHLIVRTHGDKFVRQMDLLLSNWRLIKDELNAGQLGHAEWSGGFL